MERQVVKLYEHGCELVIKDLGSGLNCKKEGLVKLLRMIVSGEISTLVITHIGRLIRFGHELILRLCDWLCATVKIINKTEKLPFEQGLANDMIIFMIVFSASISTKKPISVEGLDFKVFKAQLKKRFYKSFSNSGTSMITAKFISTLKALRIESGIELITVKAACVPIIGRLKYATKFNFKIHSDAAMLVARRAMGEVDIHFPS